jgi:hypothetical protein
MNEPTVYTCRGTVPESELTYTHEWLDSPEMTVLREFWHFKSDGELAKNNVHAYGRKTLVMGSEQAKM